MSLVRAYGRAFFVCVVGAFVALLFAMNSPVQVVRVSGD